MSKTRESSRLKTRYLKRITSEQLFIISISLLYGLILGGKFFKYAPKFYLANLMSDKKIDIDINK